MDTEQKAKAYDEALKVARYIHDVTPSSSIAIAVCEQIFPEFKKESEDERIWKALIDYFRRNPNGQLLNEFSNREVFAWFGKQAEQKPAKTVKWSPQEESCICQLESLVKEQWRQAECVHNSVNIKKMSELMFFLKTLNPNKKPAWSEEDEKKRSLLIKILEVNHPNAYFKVNPVNTLNMEAMYVGELVDWLKSLKDRYAWKPSDAQMKALKEACDKSWEPDGFDPLYTLYEQLKKLKGE